MCKTWVKGYISVHGKHMNRCSYILFCLVLVWVLEVFVLFNAWFLDSHFNAENTWTKRRVQFTLSWKNCKTFFQKSLQPGLQIKCAKIKMHFSWHHCKLIKWGTGWGHFSCLRDIVCYGQNTLTLRNNSTSWLVLNPEPVLNAARPYPPCLQIGRTGPIYPNFSHLVRYAITKLTACLPAIIDWAVQATSKGDSSLPLVGA